MNTLKQPNFTLRMLVLVALMNVLGCTNTHEPVQVRSFGSPGDLLVVLDLPQSQLKGVKTDEWFGDDFPALPQSEKLFRVTTIPATMFGGNWRKARNIVVFRYNHSVSHASLAYKADPWAENQLVADITFPDSLQLRRLVEHELPQLKRRFYNADVFELSKLNQNAVNEKLMKRVFDTHGITLTIPRGFALKKDTVGFTWMEYETPKSTIGILVYSANRDSVKYDGKFAEWRNDNLGSRVQGEKEGSQMITEQEWPLVTQELKIGGTRFTETRGLWKMKNDFMGGPFVNLMGVKADKAIVVEGFVYAPGHLHKAVLVRSVDAVLRSVSL